jgi:hypothetical protein
MRISAEHLLYPRLPLRTLSAPPQPPDEVRVALLALMPTVARVLHLHKRVIGSR